VRVFIVDKFSTVSHSIISDLGLTMPSCIATNLAQQQRYSTFRRGSRNYESP